MDDQSTMQQQTPTATQAPTVPLNQQQNTATDPGGMNPLTCKTCHRQVGSNDYFCSNCGTNLKPAPPSTTISGQISLYLKSLILPPFGYIWGFKYLRQSDGKSKIVGLVAMIITTVMLTVITIGTINLINTVNDQVNSQLENLMMF